MRTAALALSLAVGAAGLAQAGDPSPAVAPDVVHVDAYPRVEAAFPGGVRGLPAIPYWAPTGYRPLTLDLYLPAASAPRPPAGLPLVVHIHGGGWVAGDPRAGGPFVDFPGVLASLAARGYAVASVSYRLSGEARFPAQAWDVKAAIRFLRSRAGEFGIDPARAVTWGVSAGGHLAGLAAVTCGVPELDPTQAGEASNPDARPGLVTDPKVSDCVQGAVAWSGVFDMATIADQARSVGARSRDDADAPEWKLLGCVNTQCRPDLVRLASPASFVGRDMPPLLLITGDADVVVPHRQTTQMAARLEAVGARHEVVLLPGINHSFIGSTPEQTRDAHLQALAATFRFVDRMVGTTAWESAAGASAVQRQGR